LIVVVGGAGIVFIDPILNMFSGAPPQKKEGTKPLPPPVAKEYPIADGGFKIKVLHEPKAIADEKTSVGTVFKVYKSEPFYKVAYAEVEDPGENKEEQDKLLETYGEETVKKVAGGKLEKSEPISLGKEKYPGKYIKVSGDKKMA